MSETTPDKTTVIFDSIPVKLDTEDVLRVMKARKITATLTRIADELVAESIKVAKPRATYKVCYIEQRDGNSVT
ncbi:MAG: hypothetical protein E4G93_04330, partial [Dehalococcoidia bacterium]